MPKPKREKKLHKGYVGNSRGTDIPHKPKAVKGIGRCANREYDPQTGRKYSK